MLLSNNMALSSNNPAFLLKKAELLNWGILGNLA